VPLPSATTVYYGLELLLAMPTWVVVAIYLVRDLGLSPLELILMGTAMEAAVFLFEVPTGVVADTYGRKLSLVIGFLGMGTTWLPFGTGAALGVGALLLTPALALYARAIRHGGRVPELQALPAVAS
jgi:MFS family permease